jgi:hypothetical protein
MYVFVYVCASHKTVKRKGKNGVVDFTGISFWASTFSTSVMRIKKMDADLALWFQREVRIKKNKD